MTLVPLADVWIVANFKEVQLENMKVGQIADIKVDAFPDIDLIGVIDSFSPATGSEFSILPPQNATGNWVKVVQRLPVLLRIEHSDHEPVLRAGMTVKASIDTEQILGLPDFVPDAIANWHRPGFVRRALARRVVHETR